MTFLIRKLVATSQEGMEDLEMKIVDGLCAWLCLTLCDPLDCSPPGSSVHGIFQARIVEGVSMPFM